ncbi:unnamed protein product [Leptosia nina]|uniref:Ribosomal RNA-processing protein 42 n=1 Tax=Leptosia nina TaxID=320188 RepID=A0AAV1J7F2_9NEOP
MAGMLLSNAERFYIWDGVEENFRSDGRSNKDYRPMELETDVVSSASGSARLRLANTDVLVCVKTEIDTPKSDKPGLGSIEFFVDCSANATPEFEGRGGEQLANRISNLLQRAYHSSQAFNLKQLCIFEGKQCWKLYVDILILECGGNLCDAVSLAVKAALFNTRIPFVKAALMDGGNIDLQLSDDPFDSKRLEVGTAPLLVTLCRMDEENIVDPTAEEETCIAVSIVVGVSGNPALYTSSEDTTPSDHKCTTISMSGNGGILPDAMKIVIAEGITAAKCLDEALGRTLLQERNRTNLQKKDSYGFLK